MGTEARWEDRTPEAARLLAGASAAALEAIGARAVEYARALAPDWGGAVRDSIAHRVEGSTLLVGSDLPLAAYAELGTAVCYEPPPEWMQSYVGEGKHRYGEAGVSAWWFRDPATGRWRRGTAQPGRHFLRRAMLEHLDEYREVVAEAMKSAGE